jgi:hypothetical protein
MNGFAMIRDRRAIQILISLGALLLASAASAETYLTVSDVPVDVTAKSAAAARDQAIAVAQAKAFDKLIKQIVANPADQARLHPSQSQIESFVQDFGVENERVSTVRYIGLYSVRFRRSLVDRYLADSNIGGVGEQRQVLVLPVFRGQSGDQLWERDNSWRAAWDRGGFGSDGPVTLILPNRDATDRATLSVSAVTGGDAGALASAIARYHAAGAVVAVAEPKVPAQGAASGLTITMTTYDQAGQKGTQTLSVDQSGGQADKALLKGVTETAGALETGWQQLLAVNNPAGQPAGGLPPAAQPAGPSTPYPVAVTIAGITEWVRLRGQLSAIPGMSRISLDALTRDNAAVTLNFAGDSAALQAALAGSGYALVQTGPAGAAGQGAYQLQHSGTGSTPAPQSVPPQPQ